MFLSLFAVLSCQEVEMEEQTHLQQYSNSVSLAEAKKIADDVFLTTSQVKNSTARKAKKKKKVKSHKIIKDNKGREALYVFNYTDNDGFSIVSSDRRAVPVLVFADSGSFDFDPEDIDLPDGVHEHIEMLKGYVSDIKDSETNSTLSTDDNVSTWNQINARQDCDVLDDPHCDNESPYPIRSITGPLIQITWGQGCGYNDNCPSAGGPCQRSYAGCVATAMAQVMQYHNRPLSYQWSSIPSKLTYRGQSSELARLMYDAGISVNMNYGGSSSSAFTSRVDDALRNDFGYSSNTSYQSYNHHVIKSEIVNGRKPVIVRAGRDGGGGHAWVVEGYQSLQQSASTKYEYYYMNWGWNGSYNAWYLYNDWSPGSRDYKNGKMMVLIRP